MRLTDRTVAEARCPAGQKDAMLFDEALPGFALRVAAAGSRTFIFQYRIGPKVRRVVLGAWGRELTAAAARKKAEALRGQVRDNRDPVAERKAARAAALEAEAVAAFTVEILIEQWTVHHLAERSVSYRARVPGELRRALAHWLVSPAERLTRTDAVRALDAAKAERGPIAANRLRAQARACWEWAVRRGALAANPWEATPRPARETPRERVLTDAELAALWRAAGALGDPWEPIVKLLILTGQRRGEVAGMRWDEVDLDAGLWSLPGSRTKNHRSHTLPLVARGGEPAGEGAAPRCRWACLRRAAPEHPERVRQGEGAARRGDGEAAEQAARRPVPWTLHDIRRTVATGLQRLGVRLEVTEALLNHVSGSRAGWWASTSATAGTGRRRRRYGHGRRT